MSDPTASTAMAAPPGSLGRAPLSLLVGLAPAVLYLSTASGHGYFLDSGLLVAASVNLGISHPPGHPLSALVGHALCLLPLGPLPYRIAAMSALSAGVAVGFGHRALSVGLARVANLPPTHASVLATAAGLTLACMPGFWLQAVRPEVYALNAALCAVAIERVVSFLGSERPPERRALYTAAVALGLGLANHHLLTLHIPFRE